MLWSPNGLNELPDVNFEVPFTLIGKSTIAFLTGQSLRKLKYWFCMGDQNKDFGAVLQTDLTSV